MTLIQPKKESRSSSTIFIFLLIPIFVGVVSIVIIYNQIVSLNHEISEAQKRIQTVKAENSELKEKVFSFFSATSLEKAISSGGLIKDKNPEYFTLNNQWALVSQ